MYLHMRLTGLVCVFLMSEGLLYSRTDPVFYVSVFVHLSLLLCQPLMKVGGKWVIKDANGIENWPACNSHLNCFPPQQKIYHRRQCQLLHGGNPFAFFRFITRVALQ